MSDDMTIVENSYYEHDEYGRIRVVNVSEGVVGFEIPGEKVLVGGNSITKATKEDKQDFRQSANPADVGVSADSVEISADSTEQ